MMVPRYSRVETVFASARVVEFPRRPEPDFHLSKGVVNLMIDAVVTLLTIADRALQRVYAGLLTPVRKTTRL
jgi:hypothetical protein